MPRGGARNRSGPQKDPNSGRSERLGVRFGKLPREGYSGRPPAWPLTTKASVAERAVWTAVWKLPQAAAWATEPWRWPTVALYARTRVRFEDDGVAATGSVMIRLADQIGLTPAGLRENGWEIEESPTNVTDAGKSSSESSKVPPKAADRPSPKQRLALVSSSGS